MKSPLLRHAATYALYIGLVLIVLSLLDYLLGFYEKNLAFKIFTYISVIACIVWATIQYRDKEKGGFLSYGDSVGYGVLLSLFYGIISAVFMVIFVTYIDTHYFERTLDITRELFYESGRYTEEQIDALMVWQEKFNGPVFLFIGTIIRLLLGALVVSLIASIFIKRNKPMFYNE